MGVKRKAENGDGIVEDSETASATKKQHLSSSGVRGAFRSDLFETDTLNDFKNSYPKSGPYPHAVVPSLIESTLLRDVRSEIATHIHFTLKETDIYRIHQSGDLANLTNLDKELLKHLPSLVRLRDALYSPDFREWISNVTGAGKLSGEKTDMAINVYTPGSYLLCHDDVIGSRRVSYILYLTDPDDPWQAQWGGGLRLYPTEIRKNTSGEDVKAPLAEHTLNIPPSFGQLSFFTVLPGESYHDVEEVYYGRDAKENKRRLRMAISGWYHIPQEGEDGYEKGLEQAQAQKSSLTQLKGAANEFDEPQIKHRHFDEQRTVMNSSATATETDPGDSSDQEDDILTEQDLTFLLQYIRAQYLTPDMIEQVSTSFDETSVLQLEQFLCDKFAREIREYVEKVENGRGEEDSADDPSRWNIARPPHKHRYAYLQEEDGQIQGRSPVSKLLVDLTHSHAFKKWLALVTRLKTKSLVRQSTIARRFRRGKDYVLASAFANDWPQLEFTISLTPSTAWLQEQQPKKEAHGTSNGHQTNSDEIQVDMQDEIEYGGEEVYMAGDDDDGSTHSKSLPHVGKKVDPAVYRAADDGDEEGILFANVPSWNQFSVVLRDKGILRFVKYISEAAKSDRWDVKGEVELDEDAFNEAESEVGSMADDETYENFVNQFEEQDEDEDDDPDGDSEVESD